METWAFFEDGRPNNNNYISSDIWLVIDPKRWPLQDSRCYSP